MGSPFSSRPKSFQSSGAMTSLSAMPSPTVMACAGRRVDCVSDVTPTIRRGDPRFRFRLPRGSYGRRHAARRVLLVVDAAVEDVLVGRVVVDLRGPSASSPASTAVYQCIFRDSGAHVASFPGVRVVGLCEPRPRRLGHKCAAERGRAEQQHGAHRSLVAEPLRLRGGNGLRGRVPLRGFALQWMLQQAVLLFFAAE